MDLEDAEVKKALKTGTTTVGIACKEGVIMAADKRATMGYLIASKDTDKIHQVDDYMAMTIAGGVGDAQTLIRWMQAELRLYKIKHGKRISTEAAATLLANILTQYKFYPFFVQLLIGGMDESGKTRLFSVDMLGGVTEEKIASTGSGSPVAYGVLEELFKEDASLEENMKIAGKSVAAAMKRDCASGERVDLVVIDKGGVRKLEKNEVKAIIGA